MSETVTPYNKVQSKKEQVAEMFDNIAHRYDFLNILLSVGIDRIWRRIAINKLAEAKPQQILDIATGTGDLAIEATRLKPESIIGVDISKEMLEIGKKKIKKKGLDHVISMEVGDSEDLRFSDNTFDAITVSFGVRNFEHLEKGLSDMNRVLKPGGQVAILEFSRPAKFPVKQLFNFYFKFILPIIGRVFSSDQRAYTYLPESVQTFPEGDTFLNILKETGYQNATCRRLTFGICSLYLAEK